jgi:hypothetical protein
MVSVPVRKPLAVGWDVTNTLQDACAARLEPQFVDFAKSPVIESDSDLI